MSQEKIFQFRRRFDSLYWQQFLLTAGMVLLTLLLLGVSFYGLSYNDTVAERRSEMRQHAELIANMSGDYLASNGQTQSPSLQNLVALAAGLTKADFLLCNQEGYALLTSDQRLGGKVVSVPQDIQDAILGDQGFYQGRSSIGGAYDLKQFVVGVPVTQEDGSTVGMVLAVMDARSLMSMWRSFIGLFFMTSAIILLISFVASSLTSMRQIQPIREMARATRAYAAGNFDVRMQDTGRNDEIGELAASFNNMADSLAETASTFNEVLTVSAAIDAAESKDEKLALIESQLSDACQIICDIYSRFLFESSVFEARPQEFLDADRLCQLMLEAQKKAYGDGLDQSCLHPYMWLCKGHYYSGSLSFYNFPYAFGGLFARGLYAKYQQEGKDFVPLYKKMLHATSVTCVEDTAKIAGIDLTDKAFWRQGLQSLADEIDLFCQLVK